MNRRADISGYHSCPCRDCFEIAIGGEINSKGRESKTKPALCHECEKAGCEPCDCRSDSARCPHGECQVPPEYGEDY